MHLPPGRADSVPRASRSKDRRIAQLEARLFHVEHELASLKPGDGSELAAAAPLEIPEASVREGTVERC